MLFLLFECKCIWKLLRSGTSFFYLISLNCVAHAQYRSCSWQDSNNREVTDSSYFFDIFNMSLSSKLNAEWLMFKLLERDGRKDINTTNHTNVPEKESELACSTECYVYITVEMSHHSCTHFERKKRNHVVEKWNYKTEKTLQFFPQFQEFASWSHQTSSERRQARIGWGSVCCLIHLLAKSCQ